MKSSPSIWHLLNTYRQIDSEDFIIFCGLLTNHKLTLQCNHLKRKGKCFRIKIIKSNALRCTFLGNRKTCLAQNLCNLSYLISQRQEHQKKMCSLMFSLHRFVHHKCFWTLFKNVHCQGRCSLRPCILRPYCIFNSLIIENQKSNWRIRLKSLLVI